MMNYIVSISFVRWLRIIIGLFFLFAAFGEKRWSMGILGGVLVMQGILNKGCGLGASSCGPSKGIQKQEGFDPNKSIRKLNL
jgi:hypothetical protein